MTVSYGHPAHRSGVAHARAAVTAEAIEATIASERRLLARRRLRYALASAQYYHRWYNQTLLRLLEPRAGAAVLDCGCGTGILLPPLRARGARPIGLDVCVDGLRDAHRAAPGTPLIGADMAALPIRAGALDQIVCRGALHRLRCIDAAFAGFFAALKGGGDLVCAEPLSDAPLIGLLRSSAVSLGIHPLPGGMPRRSSRDWITAAERAGFETVRWSYLGYVALPLVGFPDALPLVGGRSLPVSCARALLGIDRLLARVPYVNRCAWQGLFHFRRPA
jgi:ubiquinone/menaquinone biosynthesis C-methylase UbiE